MIRKLKNHLSTFLIKLGYKIRSEDFHLNLFCSPAEHIGQAIIKNGVYDLSTINSICEVLGIVEGKKIYLDIGANIGNHACVIGQIADEVMVFEPNPLLAKILEVNLEYNKIKNFSVRNVALGETKQNVFLSMPQRNHGEGRIVVEKYGNFEVDMTSLDMVLFEKKYSNLELIIKLDVEGYELQVLRGAMRTLKDNTCHLFVEYSGDTQSRDVAIFLNSCGYIIDAKQDGAAAKFTKIASHEERLRALVKSRGFYHAIYWSKDKKEKYVK